MAKVWRYGDAGDRWKVGTGDVWAAGNHILGCGDIEHGYAERLMAKFGAPDITYVDPPWSQGNAKSFYTKAGLVYPETGFILFLQKLIDVVRVTKGPVYIEMGKQHVDDLQTIIINSGGKVLNVWGVTYYRKYPSFLVRAVWGDHKYTPDVNLTSMDDDDTPSAAITYDSAKSALVFDPCMGRGLTCRSAHQLGRRFVGLELHPRRLACAVDWLSEQGEAPRRLYPVGAEVL